MKSALYTGQIRHRRFEPKLHDFKYSIALFYLDLDEVDVFFRYPGLCAKRGPAWIGFRRADYLGDPKRPLKECVRDLIFERTGRQLNGPVRLLTQVSYLGFCFNPVSFYYCFDAAGEQVEFIIAEITNTPWNERHRYVLANPIASPIASPNASPNASSRIDSGTGASRFQFSKDFHVSPFMPMEMDYSWSFSHPGEGLGVHMENRAPSDGRLVFDATLTLRAEPLTQALLLATILRFPLLTIKAFVAIYYQALRLAWKRVPFFSHPTCRRKL